MAAEHQEYILVWETMPPAEYKTIAYRSSNFISSLDEYHEGDWHIYLNLQVEDGSDFDIVKVELFCGNATVESLYFLNTYNKDVLHFKRNESIKIRSNLLMKGKFVVKLQVKCVSSAVKSSIWLYGKTVVYPTVFKSIKSEKDGSTKFTVMLNNKEYPFSASRRMISPTSRQDPSLYINLETIPRLWGIIAVTKMLCGRLLIYQIINKGERSTGAYTLLDVYTFHSTSFEKMDKASISKISKLINETTVQEPIEATELENVHLSAKEEVFKELYTNQKLCDVTIQAKDLKIRAHKLVLASCSSVWRKTFIADETLNVVQITGFEPETISILMEYIYNGTVPQTSNTKLVQLLIVANDYDISGLKDHCSTLLAKSVHMKNVVELATLAHQYNATTLLNSVFAFIRENFEEFRKLKEFESIFFAHPELALQILKL